MKRVKFGVSGHFPEKAWREWPEILHADVSWLPSELISSWSRSVDFSNFGTILTYWNGSNLGFPGISWRRHGENGLKFCMMMHLDYLQNWLDYGYSLLIFLIFMLFWLSETGQIWGFQAFWSYSVVFSSLWWPFGWNWSYLGFLGIIWRTWGSKCRGGAEAYEFCLDHHVFWQRTLYT